MDCIVDYDYRIVDCKNDYQFSVFINSNNNLTGISIQKQKLNTAKHVIRPNRRQRHRNRTPPRRTYQRPLSPDRPVRPLLDFSPLPPLNTTHQLEQIPLVELQNTPTPPIQQTRILRNRKTIQ